MHDEDPQDLQTPPLVALAPAREAERPLIEGLMQFYIYDFSEMEPPGSTAFEFDDHGRFAPYPHLDDYWRDAKRWPLLIRADDAVVGFALINTLSHRGSTIDRNMAEFFVARKHRRHGIAAQALHQILTRHTGRWEVAVAERNFNAKAFWPKAITAAPNVSEIVRHDGDGVQWRGPIYTFRAA